MTREISHQKSFEKALYTMADNFSPGRLPGVAPYADMYINTSQGEGDASGPWNSGDQWERVDDLEDVMPADKGDGMASVKLTKVQEKALAALATRTISNPADDRTTGADLGAGPGAGKVTGEDLGQAKNINDAVWKA